MKSVLIIDDQETIRIGLKTAIESDETRRFLGLTSNIEVYTASNGEEGVAIFKQKSPDLVITDIKMDKMSGIEVIREIMEVDKQALVIALTAYAQIPDVVEAIKLGAYDYIEKPWRVPDIRKKLRQICGIIRDREEKSRLSEKNRILTEEIKSHFLFEDFIGSSKKIKEIVSIIERVAKTDSSVLITGESGTGKEMVARYIHELSFRRNGPFVKVNCGALTETLLESEMFGHEKGAFTGAIRQKLGRFELADGGTIFLDEIGELSLSTQVKLLRVLQEKEFERVGGEKTIKVDLRIIAATNRDLKKEVKEKRFREDLYYRLYIVPIEIPPLRERKEDIPELARYFIKKHREKTRSHVDDISSEALEILKKYHWPGNIRELENVIEQTLVLSAGSIIRPEDLPSHIRSPLCDQKNDIGTVVARFTHGMNLDNFISDIERQIIKETLYLTKNNKAEAAKLLGIRLSTLQYKIAKYNLTEDFPDEV
ncbi:MAG: sigma-54 dependent transcriptional regulator [Deltaproteobacteria bacterium]|nr:sigma-54 dependent transcriptional regulator [Deltaproteobacteria bacterium]